MKKKNQEKYSLYYSYGDVPSHITWGVEIYCWESLDGWESGILPITSRCKTPEEVEWLQDNLPCSINVMKDILSSFSNERRNNSEVFVVSIPPKEEELTHDSDLILNNKETYRMLYKRLGISIPCYLL